MVSSRPRNSATNTGPTPLPRARGLDAPHCLGALRTLHGTSTLRQGAAWNRKPAVKTQRARQEADGGALRSREAERGPCGLCGEPRGDQAPITPTRPGMTREAPEGAQRGSPDIAANSQIQNLPSLEEHAAVSDHMHTTCWESAGMFLPTLQLPLGPSWFLMGGWAAEGLPMLWPLPLVHGRRTSGSRTWLPAPRCPTEDPGSAVGPGREPSGSSAARCLT